LRLMATCRERLIELPVTDAQCQDFTAATSVRLVSATCRIWHMVTCCR